MQIQECYKGKKGKVSTRARIMEKAWFIKTKKDGFFLLHETQKVFLSFYNNFFAGDPPSLLVLGAISKILSTYAYA